jgi:two-component system cell cycle sensor histidine kinase/response regulator CckA
VENNNLNSPEVIPPRNIEMLEQVLNNAQVGIIITDNDHKIEYVNPEFTRIFGYTEVDAVGSYIYDLITPEEFHIELEQLSDRLEKREPSEFETIRCTKDGQRIHVLVRVSPIIIDNKRVGGFGFYSDISKRKRAQEELQKAHEELEMRVEKRTQELKKANEKMEEEIRERKRIEEALRESEERYRTAIESCNDGVSIIQGKRHVYVNQKFLGIHGYDFPQEVIGKSLDEFVHPDDLQWVQDLAIRRQKGEPAANKYEFKALRKDGTPVYLENSVAKTIYKGEAASLSFFRDITDRKRAEEERRQLEAKLQHARRMEAIGTLAGSVAHDLNNILSGLVSYPELLLMDMPQDSPLRKPILTIQKSGEKAAAIVQDLLTLARRGLSVTEPVNINQIISEYLKSPEYEELKTYHPHVTIETHLEKELLHIIGSPIHLAKTVMNLVSNAAEAMAEGGKIVISTENLYIDAPIKHKELDAGEYIVLTVSDTGMGISPEDIERIFEPFYTKKVMGRIGTGLGMTVIWGTVKDHNGCIDVQSHIEEGTTFKLYFPATREKSKKDHPAFSIEDYGGKGESILVVDDAEDQREIASDMLKRLGYSVISVSSGEEAIQYLENHSADCIILDMIMDPGIDGFETYRRILVFHPGQKAIIASGFSETDRVKEALKLGAGAYIKKPYLLEKIGTAVRMELDKKVIDQRTVR